METSQSSLSWPFSPMRSLLEPWPGNWKSLAGAFCVWFDLPAFHSARISVLLLRALAHSFFLLLSLFSYWLITGKSLGREGALYAPSHWFIFPWKLLTPCFLCSFLFYAPNQSPSAPLSVCTCAHVSWLFLARPLAQHNLACHKQNRRCNLPFESCSNPGHESLK